MLPELDWQKENRLLERVEQVSEEAEQLDGEMRDTLKKAVYNPLSPIAIAHFTFSPSIRKKGKMADEKNDLAKDLNQIYKEVYGDRS